VAGERILVVDDEPNIRKLLHRYLSGAGYTIGLAADGLEALQLVREHIPDLVITDVNMPNMNGLELTRQLRTSHKTARVPILVLSADKQESDVLKGYAQGADDYVGKPVELAILKVKVELLVRRAGPPAAAAAEPGSVILLMHGKGGVGATTLAVNCAIAATSRSPDRVGILDLNLVFGNADILLDVRDPRPLSDLSRLQGEVDDQMFDSFVAPHATGARLVVANRVPETAELVSLAAVQLAIERLRRRCDHVLVDLPANFSEHTLTAIDNSSLACIVTTPRLASMKAAGDCLETLKKIGYPRRQVLVVANQVAEPADGAHFATFFGQPPDAVVAYSQLFETAADSGSPLMVKFPGSEAATEVAALAQTLVEAAGKPAPAVA
jgi:pilus assembly protein CpaE